MHGADRAHGRLNHGQSEQSRGDRAAFTDGIGGRLPRGSGKHLGGEPARQPEHQEDHARGESQKHRGPPADSQ